MRWETLVAGTSFAVDEANVTKKPGALELVGVAAVLSYAWKDFN